jgi:hypothetical protein
MNMHLKYNNDLLEKILKSKKINNDTNLEY